MFNRYGVDGIMIGRATVGRPTDIQGYKALLSTENSFPNRPYLKGKTGCFHLDKSIEFKEGKRAIFEMRRHHSNYFKGLPFRDTRLKLHKPRT